MNKPAVTRYPPYVALEQALIRTFEAMKKKELRLEDFDIIKADTWIAIWVFFGNDEDVPRYADVGMLHELERDFRERLIASKEQFSFQELPPLRCKIRSPSGRKKLEMKINPSKRYDSPEDFFSLNGSVVMKVSTDAAMAICEQAAARGLIVIRIEGGIWHAPGFEARLDCIWDGADPPIDLRGAERNNEAAAEFVRSECGLHDAYIITTLHIAP